MESQGPQLPSKDNISLPIAPSLTQENQNQNALTPSENRQMTNELNDLAETAATPVNPEEGSTALKTPFLWPHENLDLLKARRRETVPFSKARYRDNYSWYLRNRHNMKGTGRGEAYMRRANGAGTEFLSNKFQFVEAAKELGYQTPKQILVSSGDSSEAIKRRISSEFVDPEQTVFLKPIAAANGSGIKITKVSNADKLLVNTTEDTVVQEAVDIGREYRYVVYQDGKHIWRIAFEKQRPTVEGDGHSTIGALLEKKDVPEFTRLATMWRNRKKLGEIIPAGEQIQMLQVGFPKKGNFQKMPEDPAEIRNLDQFMAQFVGDFEKKVGHKLPLLAFDMGIKGPDVLKGDYDFDAIHENAVPIECQMPFSTFFYYKNVPKGLQVFANFSDLRVKNYPKPEF